MNKQLRVFAEATLKEGLAKCTEDQRLLFKKMYAHGNLEMPIDKVVDNLPDEKIDWAMQQVEQTLKSNTMKKRSI